MTLTDLNNYNFITKILDSTVFCLPIQVQKIELSTVLKQKVSS